MRLSRIDLAIVAIEISKREFVEEYEVLRMLRISKNKLNAICESGELHRNIRGNRAYYIKHEIEEYALGIYMP